MRATHLNRSLVTHSLPVTFVDVDDEALNAWADATRTTPRAKIAALIERLDERRARWQAQRVIARKGAQSPALLREGGAIVVSANINLPFDVDLALKAGDENPVYYVQYAHARICSVLRAWQEAGGGDVASLKEVDLSPLDGPQAQALMLQLAKYPDMLTAAAEGEAPHDVTFYLRDLAASYHSYYDAERILVDDETVRTARLALVAATARVLHNGLSVLGVSAPARM